MKPHRQRIAIAEACGFKCSEYSDELAKLVAGFTPDYLNDLNAMHEAEATLRFDDRNHYIDRLGETYHDSWEFCTATAAQRAEAFLRTIGKWEDDE
jgi:hypothetical protein